MNTAYATNVSHGTCSMLASDDRRTGCPTCSFRDVCKLDMRDRQLEGDCSRLILHGIIEQGVEAAEKKASQTGCQKKGLPQERPDTNRIGQTPTGSARRGCVCDMCRQVCLS